MRYQINRIRNLYRSALPGVGLLDPDGRFAIGAAGELYQAILSEIEENDYDVFNHRAYIGKIDKIRRLPGIWWRTRTGYRDEIILN
jgi:phytoene synthase